MFAPIKLATRHGSLYGLVVALSFLVAPQAWAADDDKTELDKVEVTGSRIRRVQVEGANPVVTVSRDDLDKAGVTSIADFMQQLTASGSALNTKFNSSGNFGFPPDASGVGAGSAQVDLRHLKAKRTLVLVDGKRWINESSASGVGGAVDLNTIPMSIVERIEVLLDGASTIYGSDAIAGVVNVITRHDFEGMDVRATNGSYLDSGDGQSETYELSMGKSDSKSSVFISLSYTDVEEVASSSRSISLEPVPGTGVTRGSSATPFGRALFFNGVNIVGGLCPLVDTDNDLIDDTALCNVTPNGPDYTGAPGQIPPTFSLADYHGFTTADRFNFQPYNMMLTPSARTSAFLQGTYQLSDDIRYYAKFLYNTRGSLNRAAPEPIFLGPEAGNGNIGDQAVIDITNPYNPFGQTLAAPDLIFLTRRPVEGGPRLFEQNVNTFYFGTGLEGTTSVFDTPWDWNVNYIYSRNQAAQETRGTYNIAHIVMGVGPLANCTADPQCVPLNLFGGPGTLDATMLDYISAVLHDTSEQELKSYSFNLSGEPFALPAGNLGLAFGMEHRSHSGDYQPDTLSSSGEANGVPSQPTAGAFDVDEFYGEVIVPVVADAPFAELIELDASVRFSDYSTSGSTSTMSFGGRWQVNDQFLFRFSWGEGFRAPSIGELFGSQSRFDATLVDPCSGPVAAITPECVALGVQPAYVQLNPQISILTGGNAVLDPEESESLTWGFVYAPEWARSLPVTESLEFDVAFYDFQVDGAIQALDAQTQLDNCVVNGPTSTYCNGIVRTGLGSITSFNNTLTNIGSLATTGWDINMVWRLEETALGSLKVSWYNSFVGEFLSTEPADPIAFPSGFETTDLAGVERNDSAIPEWTSNLVIDWGMAKWTGTWRMRMIGGVTEACTDDLFSTLAEPSPNSLTNLGLCSIPDPNGDLDDRDSLNRLGTTVYHDAQVAYAFGDLGGMDTTFKVGINNLFAKEPPFCRSCSLNGYDASTYEIPGRFVYVALVGRFD